MYSRRERCERTTKVDLVNMCLYVCGDVSDSQGKIKANVESSVFW